MCFYTASVTSLLLPIDVVMSATARSTRLTAMTTLVVLAPIFPVAAQSVPTVMTYQGHLSDNTPEESPINAKLPMTFSFYGSPTASDLKWTENWPLVTVTDGIFNVLLGSNGTAIPTSVFTGGTTRYLEVVVDGDTLHPREQLGSVGWANQAESAADLVCVGCVDSSDLLDSSVQSADIALNTITAADLADNSVGFSEIATDAVRASEIIANAVGNSELNNTQIFTVGGLTANGKVFVSRNSSTAEPQIELYETQADYARIKFRRQGSTNSWDIAAFPHNTPSSGWLNFYSSAFGNTLRIRSDGYVFLSRLGTGYAYDLCVSGSASGYLGRCSSSRRYKENLLDLTLGLATVMQMRPVTFQWKRDGTDDLGFVAEEMSELAPLLATYNEDGQPEGVRYRQLTSVLAKAIQEQQAQIEKLQERLAKIEAE